MKLKTLILFLPVFLFTGCLNDIGLNEPPLDTPTEELPFVDEPFNFSKLIDPAIWRTFNSMEEMIDACQIPEDALKQISTDNLIISCMNYPLFFTYSAYNNELVGIEVIMDNFNGFKELFMRDSAAEKIIDYYTAMEVELTDSALTGNSILHLGYIELIIASGKIPDIFNANNIQKIEDAISIRMMEKLNHSDIYSIYSVRKSLLLGAVVTLQKGAPISKDEKELLEDFIKLGGVVESTQYTEVSKIINS